MANRTATIDCATIRALAVAASADPRSVVRVLRGEHVRGMADTRIREALAARGITLPPSAAPDLGSAAHREGRR